jgi:hypothetical protein
MVITVAASLQVIRKATVVELFTGAMRRALCKARPCTASVRWYEMQVGLFRRLLPPHPQLAFG